MSTISGFFEEQIINTHNAAAGGPSCSSADTSEKKSIAISFIGSGGKTSLIWLLAHALVQQPQANTERRKILITPTTKMYLPNPQETQYDYLCTEPPVNAAAGITVAGRINKKSGKLESFSMQELERIAAAYDIVLIEADGSGELPLKGWADHEPVVPFFTDYTVGIVPLWPLGMLVSEKIIHRLPQFCALCEAQPNETLSPRHLARVICGTSFQRSLFSTARGKKVLFLNHREHIKAITQALEIMKLLPPEFRSSLHAAGVGNLLQNSLLNYFT